MPCSFPGLRPPEIPNQFYSFIHRTHLRLRNRSALFGEIFEIDHVGTRLFFKHSRHEPPHKSHRKTGKLEFVFTNPSAAVFSGFFKIILLDIVDSFRVIGHAEGFGKCFCNHRLNHNQMAFAHLVLEFPLKSFFPGFPRQWPKRLKPPLPVLKIVGIFQ